MGNLWSRQVSSLSFRPVHTDFNCDELVEQTQLTSPEIKFLHHFIFLHFEHFVHCWEDTEFTNLAQFLTLFKQKSHLAQNFEKFVRYVSVCVFSEEKRDIWEALFDLLAEVHDEQDELIMEEAPARQNNETLKHLASLGPNYHITQERILDFYELIEERRNQKQLKREMESIFAQDVQLTKEQWMRATPTHLAHHATLLSLARSQKRIFKPILDKIHHFLIEKQYAGEMTGPLEVKEGGLLSSQWVSYQHILKGGILSEYHHESKVMKQFVPLFGCNVEPCTERGATPRTSRVLRLSRPDQSHIYLRAPDMDTFQEWYWTILMYVVESQNNRYDAFFPVRHNINAVWYVNGKPWFLRLADVLESAKEEIFLTNWWTSPEVFLRRSNPPNLMDRFDMILRKKAEEGVRIYMILWNETKVAQEGLMNRYAAKVFSAAHENFKVMMHPTKEPIIWAHHQKTMVIDQRIAFQGGVDVCWGRWDDTSHKLADPCHFRMEWPGKDYFNPLIQGVEDTYNPYFDNIDRTRYPRLSWHDLHMEVDGLAARDISRNFVERWNNSRQHLLSVEMNLASRLIIMKQYPVLSLKMARLEDVNFNWYTDMSGEMPRTIVEPHSNTRIESMCASAPATDEDSAGQNHTLNLHTCRVQVVRSMASWSGADHTEISMYRAYMDVINKAEHYIFIENQYFCSNSAGFGVQNQISEAIMNRVRWAIQNQKKFRVFILVPLTPDGPVKDSATVRCILYYNFETLFRGPTSIIQTLEKEFPDVDLDQYITINSLRAYDYIVERPITEQIYVHGKGIVVDDKYVIIASANLNDRSFLGNRDSELGAIVEDNAKVKIQMDGKPYLANRFAYTFRMFLFRELLGLDAHDNSVMDPVSDATYNRWRQASLKNTEIYNSIFPNAPSDLIQRWDQLKSKIYECDIPEINKPNIPRLKEVQGFLIETPRRFLIDGSLEPHFFDYEQRVLQDYVFQ